METPLDYLLEGQAFEPQPHHLLPSWIAQNYYTLETVQFYMETLLHCVLYVLTKSTFDSSNHSILLLYTPGHSQEIHTKKIELGAC